MACDDAMVGNAAADLGQADPGRPWRVVFARVMGVVLLWHVIPVVAVAAGVVAVAAGVVAVARQSPCADACGWAGLAVAGYLVLSLLLSTIAVAILSTVGRHRPALRRVTIVGNAGAAPGIVLSGLCHHLAGHLDRVPALTALGPVGCAPARTWSVWAARDPDRPHWGGG